MKSNSEQLVTLNEIVDKYLLDLGESAHKKEQALQWAVDFYRKYKMDMARTVKTVTLQMTPYKAIILPDDCVDWISVGIRNGSIISTFVHDRDLATRECACDEDAEPFPTYDNVDLSQCETIPFYGGDSGGRMFGMLMKDNGLGYFNPNPNQGVNEIQLSPHVNAGTPIYLMYLSTLFDPRVDSIVHPYAEDMIRAGIHYKNLVMKKRSGNRSVSSQDIRDAKQELDDEICLLAERRWDLSAETIVETLRAAKRLTPKG